MTRPGVGEALGYPPRVRAGWWPSGRSRGEAGLLHVIWEEGSVCRGHAGSVSPLSPFPSPPPVLGERTTEPRHIRAGKASLLYRWERRPCRGSGLAGVTVQVSDND